AGAGSDRWRALWEAARRFALAEGNADHFPPNAGEHCPLCQQNVEDSTAARLRRFEQFIQSDLEDRLRIARTELKEHRATIEQLPDLHVEGLLAELAVLDDGLSAEVLAVGE